MNRKYYERMQEKLNHLKEVKRPGPIRSDGTGALDIGPRNLKRDEENPDMIAPRNLSWTFAKSEIFFFRYAYGNQARRLVNRDNEKRTANL